MYICVDSLTQIRAEGPPLDEGGIRVNVAGGQH